MTGSEVQSLQGWGLATWGLGSLQGWGLEGTRRQDPSDRGPGLWAGGKEEST